MRIHPTAHRFPPWNAACCVSMTICFFGIPCGSFQLLLAMKLKAGRLGTIQIVLDTLAQAELRFRFLLSQEYCRRHLFSQKLICCKSSVQYILKENRQRTINVSRGLLKSLLGVAIPFVYAMLSLSSLCLSLLPPASFQSGLCIQLPP